MNYFYYPGCSLHSTSIEYDMSLKEICKKVNIELKEIKNWICCGASSAHSLSHLLSISLPAKVLSNIEKENGTSVVVPCAACFSRLKSTSYEIEKDATIRDEVNWVIKYPLKNSVKVMHPLELFKKEDIEKNIKKDLSQLKIVCYYGCLLTRPPKVMQFDICEYPMMMDNLLRSVGIKTLDWNHKTDCCGAGALYLTKTDIVIELCHKIIESAKEVGADAIAVACPICHANLDTRQDDIKKIYNTDYELPVLYFTQLIGLAFGIFPKKLGLNKHLVNTDNLIEKIKD